MPMININDMASTSFIEVWVLGSVLLLDLHQVKSVTDIVGLH